MKTETTTHADNIHKLAIADPKSVALFLSLRASPLAFAMIRFLSVLEQETHDF